MRRTHALLAAAFALACLASPSLVLGGESEDRSQIDALFQKTLRDGYQERDPDKILSIYRTGARVQTRVYGEVDLVRFREIITNDIKRFREVSATVTVADLALKGDEATAAVTVQRRGVLKGGGGADEMSTRYYYRVRREGTLWKVDIQSYKPDFSAAPEPGKHPALDAPGQQRPAGKYH